MDVKEIESLKNECSHLIGHLKHLLRQVEEEVDDPQIWYEKVSDFLLTKNLLANLNNKVTNSLGDFLLNPTSLDTVDADGFSELFRVRVDPIIEKEREEAVENVMASEKDDWMSEGNAIETDLNNLKYRILLQQSSIQNSTQLLREELERQKRMKPTQNDIINYQIKNDELLHPLLVYHATVNEGAGLKQYFKIPEKVVKAATIVHQLPNRTVTTKEDDEKLQLRLFEMAKQKKLQRDRDSAKQPQEEKTDFFIKQEPHQNKRKREGH